MANKPTDIAKPGAGQPERRITKAEVHAVSFTGPIPPPEALAAYDQICPGAADRIIGMAERQATHRQSLEKTAIQGNVSHAKLGQIFGFILGMVALLGGIYLLATGKSAEGYATVLGTLGTLAGIFVYGRRRQEQEREQKQLQKVEKP